jgi:hypothetical protein
MIELPPHFKLKENWYHGTPDARAVEERGGFESRTITVDYVEDLLGYREHQNLLNQARETNEDRYFELLDETSSFIKKYSYPSPIFLSNKYSVAKTYADPKRAWDYQNAVEKVFSVDVICDKVVEIIARGDRFRFINTDRVREGFIDAGIGSDDIDYVIQMFNYQVQNNSGIQTDAVGAIGHYFGFDCIDVIGVLDSYMGGKEMSTVRMVLDSSKIKFDG